VPIGSSNTKKDIAKSLLKHGKGCGNCQYYKKDEAGPPIGAYTYCVLEANGERLLRTGASVLSIFGKACEKWSLK